jgi:hypothetical protein
MRKNIKNQFNNNIFIKINFILFQNKVLMLEKISNYF